MYGIKVSSNSTNHNQQLDRHDGPIWHSTWTNENSSEKIWGKEKGFDPLLSVEGRQPPIGGFESLKTVLQRSGLETGRRMVKKVVSIHDYLWRKGRHLSEAVTGDTLLHPLLAPHPQTRGQPIVQNSFPAMSLHSDTLDMLQVGCNLWTCYCSAVWGSYSTADPAHVRAKNGILHRYCIGITLKLCNVLTCSAFPLLCIASFFVESFSLHLFSIAFFSVASFIVKFSFVASLLNLLPFSLLHLSSLHLFLLHLSPLYL